jgi:hypothetical protein
MKKGFLSFITFLSVLHSSAQQNSQQRPSPEPVPNCGLPISFPIVLQPVSQTVCAGSNAVFTAACPNDGSYWEMSTDNGTTWVTTIPNSVSTSGNYQDTLTVLSVSPQMNNTQFRCYYRGSCRGFSITTPVTLTVSNNPTHIIAHPQNLTTCKYTSADFIVAATGSSLTYQWQQSNDSGNSFADIPGKTSALLHIDSVSIEMNSYKYRCIVNSECNPSVISDASLLSVQDESTYIITQPLTQAACVGSTVTLMIAASGNMVTYQWQNNTNTGYTDIDSATSPTLLTSYHIPSTKEYRCKISSSCKTIYSNIVRVFYTAPAEAVPLSNKYACSGEEVTIPSFNYYVNTGIPGIAYHFQWQQSSNVGNSFTNIPGDTFAYKSVTASQQVNNYQYRCYLTSTCFTGYSDTMTLLVDVPVSITMQPQNKNGCLNNEVNFSIKATGSISGYQWQRSVDGGVTYQDFNCCGNGIWSPDFTLTYFTTAYNNYLYRCKVISNCFDTVYSNAAMLSTFNNPVAGNDTATTVNCDSCKINIAGLFNTTGFTSSV